MLENSFRGTKALVFDVLNITMLHNCHPEALIAQLWTRAHARKNRERAWRSRDDITADFSNTRQRQARGLGA